MVTAGVLAAVVGACGSEVSGNPGRVETDVSELNVGNYQTKPREIGNAKNDKQARAREAQRLADYVTLPYEADPSYVEDAWGVRPHIVLNRKTLGPLIINDTFDDVAKDLVAGWVNAWATADNPDHKQRTLNVAVLMFPDAQTAQTVGPTLEHDDFTYNNGNEPIQIANYPSTTAHWRPSVSSIGAWTVHDRYVIFMKIVDDTSAPDLPALTAQVEKMLGVQLPLLDKFQPTPAADLQRIPLDPPGLLGRTLPSNPDAPVRAEPDGLYTGRGSLSLLSSPGQDELSLFERTEVDLVSFGDAVVFRSKSNTGSEALWQEWRPSTHSRPGDKTVDAPTGLGQNIECYAKTTQSLDKELIIANFCFLQVDRYVIQAAAKQLQDLHQKISAQYALLTAR
ncbi:hypothetical protein OG874_40590 [Nocardia sp. NBC_00565]|uniref:DUF7373 family lipoprotein n=1 Tax=Nocardia sp. NBC_00565 TaxID=2975993 RepID=UPI002E822FB3|nr:hypothetical protein [Nocardia sp. NBC_00565]WUC02925.1 hypothetical protein OG874_40590 [Nocardia sp. NBC_00565]